MSKKDPSESYKHFYAKKLLASWLRDAARTQYESPLGDFVAEIGDLSWNPIDSPWPWHGVYDEYTLDTDCRNGILWSARGWPRVINGNPRHCPTAYDAQDGCEIYVADILVESADGAAYVIEIVHKSDISGQKCWFYEYLKNAKVLHVKADWILGQTAKPETIVTMTEGEAGEYANREWEPPKKTIGSANKSGGSWYKKSTGSKRKNGAFRY